MDFWELASEVDSIFVLLVLKVVPQAVIEDDRVRFLLLRRREDKEVVSLSVLQIISSYACDAGVSCLWRIWFKVCDLTFVKPVDGFYFLSFV